MELYNIRAIQEQDVPFLWDMLYEICRTHFVREGKEAPARDILQEASLVKYVQAWGRGGDTGFIAAICHPARCANAHHPTPIGAAWYRLYQEYDKGYGYVDEATPEISIAVAAQYTGKGIGFALMNHLLQQALLDGYPQVSLSVDPKNPPALHLYQKFGFEKIGAFGTSWVMKKVLS